MKEGEKITAFRTLRSFGESLPESFFRIHMSYIVNSKFVSRINYGKSTIEFSPDGYKSVPFSPRFKENIDKIKNIKKNK